MVKGSESNEYLTSKRIFSFERNGKTACAVNLYFVRTHTISGGCPNSDPLPGFIKQGDEQLPAREQQENIRQFACDEVDYAWLGLAGKSFEQDGFIYAEFEIKTVLKPGREEDEFADNNVRVVKARDRCTSFNMTEGTEYIIMGKDSEYNENAELGPPQPVYLIDTAAIVIPKKQSGVKQKLVNWFIDEFQDEDRRCFS